MKLLALATIAATAMLATAADPDAPQDVIVGLYGIGVGIYTYSLNPNLYRGYLLGL